MTQPKHTPGPWLVGPLAGRDDANGNDERVIHLYDGGPVIATAWPMGEDFDRTDAPEREANARLIAKAPELLELIRAYLNATSRTGVSAVLVDKAALDRADEAARALLAEIDGGA